MPNYFFVNAFIGACLASHAAVITERTAANRNFMFCRSRCNFCGNKLSLLDEIPIMSYLLLRGRCRYCHAKISPALLTIEILGAFAFIKINFASPRGILKAIFLFYFLLAALQDLRDKEFSAILFLPPTLIAIFLHFTEQEEWILPEKMFFSIIASLLLVFTLQKKMGIGDLWAYLLLAFAYSPTFANEIFCLASLLMLLNFISLRTNSQEAFIPYLFFSLIYFDFWA